MSANGERPAKMRRVSGDTAVAVDPMLHLISISVVGTPDLLEMLAGMIVDTFLLSQIQVSCDVTAEVYESRLYSLPHLATVHPPLLMVYILVRDSTKAECDAFVDWINMMFPPTSTVQLSTFTRPFAPMMKRICEAYPTESFRASVWRRKKMRAVFEGNMDNNPTRRFRKILREQKDLANNAPWIPHFGPDGKIDSSL